MSHSTSLSIPDPLPQLLLFLHNLPRQRSTDPHEHKRRPLPPEGINHDHEDKPVNQLSISKELERSTRRSLLDEPCEINPELHQSLIRSRQRINEKHEQETRVDADMVVPNRADGVHVRAVVGADIHVPWREDLEVPVWWFVILFKALVREERERRSFVACSHDADIAFDMLLPSWAAFWNALRALFEHDAGFGEVEGVASKPIGAAASNLLEDIIVDHRGFGEESFAAASGRGEVVEVAVKEDADKTFGNP